VKHQFQILLSISTSALRDGAFDAIVLDVASAAADAAADADDDGLVLPPEVGRRA